MNKLVKHLAEHYHPGGNAFRIVLVPELLENQDFTVEEVFDLAMEAYKKKHVLIGRIRVRGNRWGVDQMIPEDLDSITITREGLAWYKESRENENQ
jgi:hypothetical protein